MDGSVALLLFDYSSMDTWYGRQAFEAIYACLKNKPGACLFFDGDLFDMEVLSRLVESSRAKRLAGEHSVFATKDFTTIGVYAVAMWSSEAEHIASLHNCLLARVVPGYQGLAEIGTVSDHEDFLKFCSRSLGLPQSIFLRDGAVIPGTEKYDIS